MNKAQCEMMAAVFHAKSKEHQTASRTIQERSSGAPDLAASVQQEVTLATLCATFAFAYSKASEVAEDADPSRQSDEASGAAATAKRRKEH